MADATPMTDLVKQAVAETRQLVELEVRIAKAEMKEELAHAKRAALLAFALFILVVLTFSALLV
ncbi:MAG TPA: phage holin family protein, partial [Polyangiaceae bacterium]